MNRVLIIEDNLPNRVLERDLLIQAGFEVDLAERLKAGIAAALRNRPDLIVLDVQLPDARGADGIDALRAEPSLLGVPIVVVTAAVIGEEVQAVKSACDAFLSKPIDTRTFVDDLSRLIRVRPR